MFNTTDRYDQWLERYTQDTFTDKFPSEHIFNALKERYPLPKTTKVYRGMNFKTKELYDNFMNSIIDGYIDLERITSWSKIKGTADSFAYTIKSYGFEYVVANSYDKMMKNKEKIMGYRGIVLSTYANPNNSIDVTASPYCKENEVIVGYGKLKVEIEYEVMSYEDEFKEKDINEFILSLTKPKIKNTESDYREKMDYIFHHFSDKLSVESRKKLFNLYKKRNRDEYVKIDITPYHSFSDKEKWFKHDVRIRIFFPMNFIYEYLCEEDQEYINRCIQYGLKKNVDSIMNLDHICFTGLKLFDLTKYMDSSTYEKYMSIYRRELLSARKDGEDKIRENLANGNKCDMVAYMDSFVSLLKSI